MYMSEKGLHRIRIFKEVSEKRLKISKAAQQLGLSLRQAKRLKKRYKAEGANGLISKKVGARGNRQVPEGQKMLVLDFLNEKDHWDFGPTLTHEYLVEAGSLTVSVSAVRSVMLKNGLWAPKKVRRKKVYELRPRRSRRGELVQLDGSEHDWFEGRGSRCTLLVYVDDATSETLHLKFVKSENTFDYFRRPKNISKGEEGLRRFTPTNIPYSRSITQAH
jgi:transposase